MATLGVALTMSAQNISKNAIGLRFGGSDGFGTEINYQRAIAEAKRLEFGLAWHSHDDYDGIKLTGLYEWVWVLDGNFNWYVGAGGGFGQADFNNHNSENYDNELFGFIAGVIGLEYNFDIPLLIALDLRPEVLFGDHIDNLGFDLGLALRYQF